MNVCLEGVAYDSYYNETDRVTCNNTRGVYRIKTLEVYLVTTLEVYIA